MDLSILIHGHFNNDYNLLGSYVNHAFEVDMHKIIRPSTCLIFWNADTSHVFNLFENITNTESIEDFQYLTDRGLFINANGF